MIVVFSLRRLTIFIILCSYLDVPSNCELSPSVSQRSPPIEYDLWLLDLNLEDSLSTSSQEYIRETLLDFINGNKTKIRYHEGSLNVTAEDVEINVAKEMKDQSMRWQNFALEMNAHVNNYMALSANDMSETKLIIHNAMQKINGIYELMQKLKDNLNFGQIMKNDFTMENTISSRNTMELWSEDNNNVCRRYVSLFHYTLSLDHYSNDVRNSCPNGFKLFQSSCHFLHPSEPVSWFKARALCQNKSSVLMHLNDLNDDRTYEQLLNKFPSTPKVNELWLGGSDIDSEGSWCWLNGFAINYLTDRWNDGTPIGRMDENCLALVTKGLNFAGNQASWKIADRNCYARKRFFCTKTTV